MKKRMRTKKFFAVALSVVLLFTTLAVASFAEGSDSVELHVDDTYGYRYTTFTDECGRTVTCYKSQEQSASLTTSQYSARSIAQRSVDYSATKALLSDLGLFDEVIEEMTDEQLSEYASAISITAISSYIKTDKDGNTTVVDEATARAGAAGTYVLVPIDPSDGGGGSLSDVISTLEDEYMELTFIATELGSGRYSFSLGANWLKMPTVRLNDSIGISVMNFAIINNSRTGYISYNKEKTGEEKTYEKVTIPDTKFQNCVNGNWYGSGFAFSLPSGGGYQYSNMRVYFDFQGNVIYPTLETYFNAVATYDHGTLGVQVENPTMELSLSGGQPSMGLKTSVSIIKQKETRTVEFPTPFHYVP